ncbi:unnamed protein product [Rhizoctonia solani]|uniref:T6SS Phospholipase effector Tle1-like catalytic domain-containing protein n=1 Tax=Rhizoctonia solani TaxID=456999 RepID=A0A8H3DLB0_9AGAM|nr:unnamed protein product [Rhizoctonia solani]
MTESTKPSLDPTPNHELFLLDIVDRPSNSADIIVRATPLPGKCVFDDLKYADFNLSKCVGVNQSNKLEWGLSGLQAIAKNPRIECYGDGPERYLVVDVPVVTKTGETSGQTRSLNLDKYLGLIEFYDDDAGEIRTKLTRKREISKRSIILCFDGTSNHFSNRNTNVVKLVELLKKDDPSQQMVYYQAGVGTYMAPGLLTVVGQAFAAKVDEGVAWYLYQHVIDGYRYLMQTYRAGDQVSIFGFSRGAYTARALAGMLHSVGLLPRHNLEQVPFAYQVYAESDKSSTSDNNKSTNETPNLSTGDTSNLKAKYKTSPKDIHPDAFKRAFCIPITITFLGVWDTVGSVGALTRKTLPHIEYNPSVIYFRQALALDENRGNFIPSLWDHTQTNDNQDALEVWFKGGHCDVGGGSGSPEDFIPDDAPAQEKPARLSDISLRWMIRQCLVPGVLILFDPKAMRRYRKHRILEVREPGASEEAVQKASDILDMHDIEREPSLMYEKSWGWWLLDWAPIPLPKLSQLTKTNSRPDTVYWPNCGAARIIYNPTLKDSTTKAPIHLHASVYAHLKHLADEEAKRGKGGKVETVGKGYKPSAEWYGWGNQWPIVEEGVDIPSVMSSEPNSASASVRAALKMRNPKPSRGWFSFSGWFGGS